MKRALLCGSVAAFMQACLPEDLTPVPQADLEIIETIRVGYGEEQVLPLMDTLVSYADDSLIIAPHGEFGHEAFSAGLWQSNDRLQELIANGQFYYFDEPSYEHAMFFADHSHFQDKEFIAINLSLTHVADPFIEKAMSAAEADRGYAPYSLYLHEASHDLTKDHTKELKDEMQSDEHRGDQLEESEWFYESAFERDHDYTMFIDYLAQEIERNFDSVRYLEDKFSRYLDCYVDRPDYLIPGNVFKSYEPLYERYKTKESFGAYMADNSPLLTGYLQVPKEKVSEVYQNETDWHEMYVEGFLEAYLEFRQEHFQEYQEWKLEEQQREGRHEWRMY